MFEKEFITERKVAPAFLSTILFINTLYEVKIKFPTAPKTKSKIEIKKNEN